MAVIKYKDPTTGDIKKIPFISDGGGCATFPVGAIYMSTASTSPASFIGGTWERIKDVFLLAAGDTYAAGETGGEATHTLIENELPSHNHAVANTGTTGCNAGTQSWPRAWINYDGYVAGYTSAVGGNGAHNNMPPYLSIYVWKRTA